MMHDAHAHAHARDAHARARDAHARDASASELVFMACDAGSEHACTYISACATTPWPASAQTCSRACTASCTAVARLEVLTVIQPVSAWHRQTRKEKQQHTLRVTSSLGHTDAVITIRRNGHKLSG
eukprot:201624-Pleurochrysis_carterae.AAC.2